MPNDTRDELRDPQKCHEEGEGRLLLDTASRRVEDRICDEWDFISAQEGSNCKHNDFESQALVNHAEEHAHTTSAVSHAVSSLVACSLRRGVNIKYSHLTNEITRSSTRRRITSPPARRERRADAERAACAGE
ncbi:hypothetical protein EVAR_46255_1 [Eumeta japonica]|uniref:Uncharacterized protein n=1 Tax=Eumeta variegata TaxID=151549 RepID=A0A4C1Y7K0_EUMVA|nr:hypothetical protein EVAR_46255_1 [Eumeta japonica]